MNLIFPFRRGLRQRLTALILCSLSLALPRTAAAQTTTLAQPFYQNLIYTVAPASAPGKTSVPLSPTAAISIISGNSGSTTNPATPNNGNYFLVQSVIGQPFGNVPFISLPPGEALVQFPGTNQILYSGQLTVTTTPAAAHGQWRLPWDTAWRESGTTVSNLSPGNYSVIFRNFPGYVPFPEIFQSVAVDAGPNFLTNTYYPTPGGPGLNGALKVLFVGNNPAGAGWRFFGETNYRSSGAVATNLVPDAYSIEFSAVTNRTKPPNLSVTISAGLTNVIQITSYSLITQFPPSGSLLPFPAPATNSSEVADYPFIFNGRLQSDPSVGYGSGVAVQTNVVLTAAHLVFNDQTLSSVTNIFWYPQQQNGTLPTQPIQARGFYILTGYSSQRTNDLSPTGGYSIDQPSPQSQNWDVAAVYFLNALPGKAFGGYLSSDIVPNPWLTGTSEKMLAGYPVDGSDFGDPSIVPGQLYQTSPSPNSLVMATNIFTNLQSEVYLANWFFSYPGNSGGPLYVENNGYYYPAGVYLGSLYNGTTPFASVVRAIDANVVDLINRAQNQASTGSNNSGGGVLRFEPPGISSGSKAIFHVILGPNAAVAAGANWGTNSNLLDNPYNPDSVGFATTNGVQIYFRDIPGWNVPTSLSPSNLVAGQVNYLSANYTVKQPSMLFDPANGFGLAGTVGTTYLIQYRTNLVSGQWLPLSTNTLARGTNYFIPLTHTNGASVFYRALWLQY